MTTNFSFRDFAEALKTAPTLESPLPPASFADLTLDGVLGMMAGLPPGPRRLTIVITRWVYGAYTVSGDGGELYILADHAALDRIKAELSAPMPAGLSALAGVPVIEDDDLAARLILKAIALRPASPPSEAGVPE